MPTIAKVAADGTVTVREMTVEEAAEYEAAQVAPQTAKQRLAAYAVAKRSQKVNAGILFNGNPIPTDEQGRGFVIGAFNKAVADVNVTKRWQTSNAPITFVTLSNAEIRSLGLSVDAYVQACFDKLDDVAADIEAGTITTKAEIDTAFASVSQVFIV